MEPANEHDPTMDAGIVHAVNVNNKKEVAEINFLTKSLENARRVQENIYRQEEKDLLKQLWKLHKDKERRHSEIDYSRRSSHGLQRGSSGQIGGAPALRNGSCKTPTHRHHVDDDRHSYIYHTGENHHPTISHHHQIASNGHYTDRNHGESSHHIPFIEENIHHLVHHRNPDFYPPPPTHRGSGGYQPPVDVPWMGSQSSKLNVIVQPAGYGHSVTEHACQLRKHKHYNRGNLYQPHQPHHPSHMHPSQVLVDDIRNAGSYESLTRYIILLDYQSSQEATETVQRRKPHHHHKVLCEQKHPQQGKVEDKETHVREKTEKGTEIAEVPTGDEMKLPKTETTDETQMKDQDTLEHNQNNKSGAKPKSIGFIGVPSATPSPTIQAYKADVDPDHQKPSGSKTQDEASQKHSLSSFLLQKTEKHQRKRSPETKTTKLALGEYHSKGKGTSGVAAKRNVKDVHTSTDILDAEYPASQGASDHHPMSHHLSTCTSSHPHQLTKQIFADVKTIQVHPTHHTHRYPSHHHTTMAHITRHEPNVQATINTAERKRLALELLAQEYPVLLRHAPTKFDPLDALMCRYLRLSANNVENLEQMCLDAGIEVGPHVHAHHQIDNVNEYVFGIEK